MKQEQITIKDLAKALNISPSTVSRALKDHPEISQETKDKVAALAQELDYQPNSVALSLRKQETKVIGVLIPELVHHFFSTVISGIESVVNSRGYNVMICQSNESYEKEMKSVQTLLASRVDGLFISLSSQSHDFAHFNNVIKRGVPLIFFDRVCKDVEASLVTIEDFKGAFMAVKHLIEQGCRRILHLAGPENLLISQNRQAGYIEAHKESNITLDATLICQADNRHTAKQTVEELLKQGQEIDGIFAVNDDTAVGAMLAVQEAGYNVPKDIAIVGFGNNPITELVRPKITSVSQPGFEMGRAAAKIFLHLRQNKEAENRKEVLPVELFVRESSQR